MVQLHSIKIEKPNFPRRKDAMRGTDHDSQILVRFSPDSILYVSYFLTGHVAIQHTPFGAGIGPSLLMA
jgi:hypothetical protein